MQYLMFDLEFLIQCSFVFCILCVCGKCKFFSLRAGPADTGLSDLAIVRLIVAICLKLPILSLTTSAFILYLFCFSPVYFADRTRFRFVCLNVVFSISPPVLYSHIKLHPFVFFLCPQSLAFDLAICTVKPSYFCLALIVLC